MSWVTAPNGRSLDDDRTSPSRKSRPLQWRWRSCVGVLATPRRFTFVTTPRRLWESAAADLVTADPQARIGDVMTEEVLSVSTDTDQEKVARTIQRYDFLAVPVVDLNSVSWASSPWMT